MPAIPLPDAQTQAYLDQARAQAAGSLKGEFPDSMLAPPPSSDGSLGVIDLGASAQNEAEPADVQGPAPTAQPAAAPPDQPATFQGFWPTLGNRVAAGALQGVQGIERLAVGAASPLMTQQFSDSLFKTVDDTWGPAIQFWQQRQQQAQQSGEVGKGAQFLGGIAEGAAPLIMGPEAFLGSSTMSAGTDTLDQGGDLKAAYTLAGVNLVANAAGMKVPFKSPNVVKRVLLNAGYGATVSAASQYLAKETLRVLGENGTADQINPLDPQSLGTNALISGIFGALEKPRIAQKFRELGGTMPGDPAPTAETAAATPKPVASVQRPALGIPPEAPVTAAPTVESGRPIAPPINRPSAEPPVLDRPSAEPLPDLQAQIADMRDPATPRKAVYLAPDNVEQLGPEGISDLGRVNTI